MLAVRKQFNQIFNAGDEVLKVQYVANCSSFDISNTGLTILKNVLLKTHQAETAYFATSGLMHKSDLGQGAVLHPRSRQCKIN